MKSGTLLTFGVCRLPSFFEWQRKPVERRDMTYSQAELYGSSPRAADNLLQRLRQHAFFSIASLRVRIGDAPPSTTRKLLPLTSALTALRLRTSRIEAQSLRSCADLLTYDGILAVHHAYAQHPSQPSSTNMAGLYRAFESQPTMPHIVCHLQNLASL